ncbi:MAG: mannose-1-phosphate guanylyltransferase, partial [Prevotella sp.]|nr:mannose-1-phosphate guanylyltransferase [Prevotella sp.]
NVYVKKCDFGWADLGAWHSIYEALQKVEDDNVVIDSDVLIDDCHNNIIKLSKGKFAVLNGLNGFIVAENDNMLLVCKKEDSSALVRKYVNEVHIKKGGEYI